MALVFVDIDTQKDFMDSEGALSVSGANSIRDNLRKLTKYASDNRMMVFKTMDIHQKGDPELQRNGGEFPDHCMSGTDGSRSILETEATQYYGFPKRCPDIFNRRFGNPGFKQKLIQENITEAVVYGVATDYCVKAAVLGMLNMGIKVKVVEDAIRGVSDQSASDAIDEMTAAGAEFVTHDTVISGAR